MAKHYVILGRTPDGKIYAYTGDYSKYTWSHTQCNVYTGHKEYEKKQLLKKGKPARLASYEKRRYFRGILKLLEAMKKKSVTKDWDLFIARVGSDKCPVRVDLRGWDILKRMQVK